MHLVDNYGEIFLDHYRCGKSMNFDRNSLFVLRVELIRISIDISEK